MFRIKGLFSKHHHKGQQQRQLPILFSTHGNHTTFHEGGRHEPGKSAIFDGALGKSMKSASTEALLAPSLEEK